MRASLKLKPFILFLNFVVQKVSISFNYQLNGQFCDVDFLGMQTGYFVRKVVLWPSVADISSHLVTNNERPSFLTNETAL